MKNNSPQPEIKTPSGWQYLIGSLFLGAAHIWCLHVLPGALPVLTAVLLSLTLSRFSITLLPKRPAYLLAVAVSFGLTAAGWGWQLTAASSPVRFWPLLLVLAANLLGAMISSWINYGFCDGPFIPTEELTERIHQIYHEQGGSTPENPPGKRFFDLVLAFLGIILSSPLWVLISLLIWLQDPGPILFIKLCTGRQARQFRLFKFRTMRINAETELKPITASAQDARVIGISWVLRQTALDELPQLINILLGEMSFVGPRPLRSVVEIENLQEIPGYARRFDSRPGLAGLAQICGSNLTPPRDKLRYEQIYTRHASLLFDFKLIAIACLIVFYLRWKKDWNGRIPRAWIRFGSRIPIPPA